MENNGEDTGWPHTCEFILPFRTNELAEIAKDVLEVNPELRPDRVKKDFSVDGSVLKVKVSSKDLRGLRASSTGFCDHAKVVVDSFRQFAVSS